MLVDRSPGRASGGGGSAIVGGGESGVDVGGTVSGDDGCDDVSVDDDGGLAVVECVEPGDVEGTESDDAVVDAGWDDPLDRSVESVPELDDGLDDDVQPTTRLAASRTANVRRPTSVPVRGIPNR